MRGLVPGEILHVGPYKTQLVDVQEDGQVIVRAVFRPNLLHKEATVQLIPTEKYLEMRDAAFAWEQLSEQERVNECFKREYDHRSEVGR